MEILIRQANISDAENILAVYAPYILNTEISFEIKVPTIEEFTKRIESIKSKYPYIVCEVDKRIVGYAYASRHRERAAYEYSADLSIYIAEDYHNKGIGKVLYTQLFKLLENEKVYSVYASVVSQNEFSVSFHKSFGFKEIGTFHNVGYKNNKWLDVICFEKQIKPYETIKED